MGFIKQYYLSTFDIPKEIKETDIELKESILNELENIEFNSTDSDGNLFYINAKNFIR